MLLSGPVPSEVRPSTLPSLDKIRAAMSFVKCRYAQGRRCQLAVLLIASILGSPMLAAAQATSGVMTGVITDAQSAVLPGVTLTLRNAETGFTRMAVTGADGRYRVGGLAPGRYELKAELPGFAPVEVRDITLTIGLEVGRNITLQLQGVQESLTVTAEAPVVETTRTDVSGVITQQQIETLPLATRQPVGLALLMPGTSQDAVRPRKFNVTVGAGAFTMGAALLVDGVWNKEGNTGEPRMDLPQAAIREYKEDKFTTVTTGRPEFYSALEGTFPIPEYSNMIFTRGDVQISPRQNVFGRYAWQDSDFTCEGCGGRATVFSGNGIQQKRYSWVGGHTWVLSSRMLNELRVQVTNVHFRSHPPGVRAQKDLFDDSPARTAPLTQVFNFPSLVWGSNTNNYSLQTQRQVRNDLSITAGKHTWKVGGGYLHIPINW